jgi:hypothetical protein
MLSNTALLALPMADDVAGRCRRREGGEEEAQIHEHLRGPSIAVNHAVRYGVGLGLVDT